VIDNVVVNLHGCYLVLYGMWMTVQSRVRDTNHDSALGVDGFTLGVTPDAGHHNRISACSALVNTLLNLPNPDARLVVPHALPERNQQVADFWRMLLQFAPSAPTDQQGESHRRLVIGKWIKDKRVNPLQRTVNRVREPDFNKPEVVHQDIGARVFAVLRVASEANQLCHARSRSLISPQSMLVARVVSMMFESMPTITLSLLWLCPTMSSASWPTTCGD